MPISPAAAASRRDFLGLGGGDSNPATKAVRSPAQVGMAAHCANRIMYGPRPGEVAAIEAATPAAWINQQLLPDTINDSAVNTLLNAVPHATLSETPTQLFDRRQMNWTEQSRPQKEVRHATIIRMLHSKRQLFERMVEFWHNHFNVYAFDSFIISMFPDYDRLIRQHAMGNFRAMLEAVGRHPVMLYYLDNYLSVGGDPNENYARELFELHTLGALSYNATGGYNDDDVDEASRCFTGWTIEMGQTNTNRGQFKYVAANHDTARKFVLNTVIARDQPDLFDGRKVYDLLANHQGTAYHIALKLCRRFIGDDPPEALVLSAANVFLNNTTHPNQIRLTMEHILKSPTFADPAIRMTKFKRPVEWIISAMRALEIPYIYKEDPADSFEMIHMFNAVGQELFGWRPPDGPPDRKFDWAAPNGLLRRCNFLFAIDSGWYTGDALIIPTAGLMPVGLTTARQIATWWANRVHGYPVSSTTLEALLVFVAEGRNYDLPLPPDQIADKLSHLAALCGVTPESMWR